VRQSRLSCARRAAPPAGPVATTANSKSAWPFGPILRGTAQVGVETARQGLKSSCVIRAWQVRRNATPGLKSVPPVTVDLRGNRDVAVNTQTLYLQSACGVRAGRFQPSLTAKCRKRARQGRRGRAKSSAAFERHDDPPALVATT